MTDIDVYQPPAHPEQYQARLVMTPQAARELDEQLRACTVAVLRAGTDYDVIPGTDGKQHLLKPGAEKLLQWFGLAYTMDCIDIERDDDGRKQGATYRCTIVKRLGDGHVAAIAVCEGYAGYEEPKFFQSAEAAQAKAEARERSWAAKDGRVANPNKWKHITDYRAPWNTLIKMAQKRALVGATIDATAAAGLFPQEEDNSSPVADDGSTWYEQALEAAFTFTTREAGDKIYLGAVDAARNGLCNRKQKDHVQNKVRQRQERLKTARPVDVEDLAKDTSPAAAAGPRQPAAPSAPAPAAAGEANLEDQPGTVSKAQLTRLHTVLTGLGFGSDDREQKLAIAEAISGHRLGRGEERSSKNLSWTEAAKLIDTLDGMDRDQLIAYMAAQEGDGSE